MYTINLQDNKDATIIRTIKRENKDGAIGCLKKHVFSCLSIVIKDATGLVVLTYSKRLGIIRNDQSPDKAKVSVFYRGCSLTTFEQWKNQVDGFVIRLTGLSCDDLPDYDFRSSFDKSEKPKQVAKRVIKNAKTY